MLSFFLIHLSYFLPFRVDRPLALYWELRALQEIPNVTQSTLLTYPSPKNTKKETQFYPIYPLVLHSRTQTPIFAVPEKRLESRRQK